MTTLHHFPSQVPLPLSQPHHFDYIYPTAPAMDHIMDTNTELYPGLIAELEAAESHFFAMDMVESRVYERPRVTDGLERGTWPCLFLMFPEVFWVSASSLQHCPTLLYNRIQPIRTISSGTTAARSPIAVSRELHSHRVSLSLHMHTRHE